MSIFKDPRNTVVRTPNGVLLSAKSPIELVAQELRNYPELAELFADEFLAKLQPDATNDKPAKSRPGSPAKDSEQ